MDTIIHFDQTEEELVWRMRVRSRKEEGRRKWALFLCVQFVNAEKKGTICDITCVRNKISQRLSPVRLF